MATIAAVIENGATLKVTWPNMQNGDVGEAVSYGAYADRSIQVRGADGVGGNLRIEGSNDGVEFPTLTVDGTTALNLTVGSTGVIKNVCEDTATIRPHVTAGNGSTLYTVTLHGRQ